MKTEAEIRAELDEFIQKRNVVCLSSPIHDWGELTKVEKPMTREDFENLEQWSRSLHLQTIFLQTICKRCGSVKTFPLEYLAVKAYPWQKLGWGLLTHLAEIKINWDKRDLCPKPPKQRRVTHWQVEELPSHMFCPDCKNKILRDHFPEHERWHESEKDKKKWEISKQIDLNLEIILGSDESDLSSRRKENITRAKVAIYRLYKTCRYSPKMIQSELGWRDLKLKEETVRKIIGEVFKEECLRNSCVFAPLLKAHG